MSVETTTRKEAAQAMTALITEFTFSFRSLVTIPSDIKCIRTTTATSADEDMTYVADLPEDPTVADILKYTVTVNDDGIGGEVEVAYVSTSCTITIYRETTDTQGSAYEDYNQFPASTVESDFDRRTMVSQEIKENSDRSLRLPITSSVDAELPTPEADTYLGWDADAALANRKISDSSVIERASETEATTGTNNTKYMTPLRTSQAIDEFALTSSDIDTGGTLGTSDVKVPSQKAVKTYVDAVNLDFVVGPASSTDSSIALFSGTGGSLLTNSAITISTDGTLTTDSDIKIPTEKAVKTYVDDSVTTSFSRIDDDVTEQNNVSGAYPSYTDCTATFKFYVPDGATTIYFNAQVKSNDGAHTTYLRIKVEASTTSATEETMTSATYERLTVSIPVQAAWEGKVITVTPQLMNNYGADLSNIFGDNVACIWVK